MNFQDKFELFYKKLSGLLLDTTLRKLGAYILECLRLKNQNSSYDKLPECLEMIDFRKFTRINYGCGYDKMIGYLNVDVDPASNPDLLIPIGDLSSLPKHHFEEVYAKDVLEHIPRVKSLEALLEFSSLLRDEGKLVIQTTSITQVAKKLIENPLFPEQFGWTICMFGNQVHPGDFHYTGFTDTSLTVHLVSAGFKIVQKSMVEDWLMNFKSIKIEAWDDLLTIHQQSSTEVFLAAAYLRFFERPLDEVGKQHFGGRIEKGESRRAVLLDIASSPEKLYVTARKLKI